METLLKILPVVLTAIAVIWGVFVFNKQQKFKRLQNLSEIFQRFADTEDFMRIFGLFDRSLNIVDETREITYNNGFLTELVKVDATAKLRYLALLEEVALYAQSFEVDREYAVHLFQWHFYYVFNNTRTATAFWANLGGIAETAKPYWSFQKKFSKYCNPVKSYRQ